MSYTQLFNLSPTGFEAAVVSIFRELNKVRHNITRTQPTGDGGFDFFGFFTLPPPIQVQMIPFRGEAKRYARTTAVNPKDVSMCLVARLSRGRYGIFVTTSYYTKQTQEEVLEDGYPTNLIAGADLVRIMREMRIARGNEDRALPGCGPFRRISRRHSNHSEELRRPKLPYEALRDRLCAG